MFNYEVKFLTCDETLHLKNGDFKSYKYETKKRSEESVYDAGKRSYCERRGACWRAPRPRQIRQLESKLRDRGVVYCTWTNETLITIVFSSGAIAYLTIKLDTLDVTQILFDRYCVGKISNPTVSSVVMCKSHLLLTHADRTATLVSFGKTGGTQPCRISDRDPHIQSIELGGGARRTERKITWCENSAGVRVLVWGATAIEPAPWSPALEDLANLHLYQFTGPQVSLVAYHQLENDTLAVELSHKSDNIIHVIEQIASHKNGVTLDWLRYEVPAAEERVTKLSSVRVSSTAASLPAWVRAVRVATCGGRVLATCIDGSVHVVHTAAGLLHSTSPGFIPTDVRWAGDIVLAAEEGGRLQCFDRALSLLNHHTKCLDFASYFRDPKRLQVLATTSIRGGPLVLVSFSGGPLALLRIMHPRILTSWIRSGRTNNAVSLLRTLDWETEGVEGLWAVNRIVCDALRKGLQGGAGETAAQAALGAYLAPLAPHGPASERLAPALHDLARKFFHHLLRRGRIEKAMSLAVDLADWDLFADAGWAAAQRGLQPLADEAASLAAHYADLQATDCSDSCSQCSSHSYSETDDETSASSDVVRTKPPPLPRLTHHTHNNTHTNTHSHNTHNNASVQGNTHINTLANTHSHNNTHNNTSVHGSTHAAHNNTLTNIHSHSNTHNNTNAHSSLQKNDSSKYTHNNTLTNTHSHNKTLTTQNNTRSTNNNTLTIHNNTRSTHNNTHTNTHSHINTHTNTRSTQNPTIVHVPITHTESISTNSIRPNLHQYLERDNTIWNTRVRDDTHIRNYDIKPILSQSSKWHSVDGLLNFSSKPKHNLLTINEGTSKLPHDDRMTPAHFRHLLQTELREDVSNTPHTLYRYQNSHNLPTGAMNRNKVKFSDTVTITVVPESEALPSPARELADSLPLCPPHKYLSAFAPLPATPLPTPQPPAPAGTPLDYVEV